MDSTMVILQLHVPDLYKILEYPSNSCKGRDTQPPIKFGGRKADCLAIRYKLTNVLICDWLNHIGPHVSHRESLKYFITGAQLWLIETVLEMMLHKVKYSTKKILASNDNVIHIC